MSATQTARDWLSRRCGRRPSLEIHVPISPTPTFFQMVRVLAASLRTFGGPYRYAPLIVTVGDDCRPYDLTERLPWSRALNVQWRWVEGSLFRAESYAATALERLRHPFRSDWVLLLDADVIVARRFDGAVDALRRCGAFGGLPAHMPPFADETLWQAIYQEAGLDLPQFDCRYSAHGLMGDVDGPATSPPYFNLGVLLMPANVARVIGSTVYQDMAAVRRVVDTVYRCQIAVGMSLVRHGVPWRALPWRFNCPNDPRIERAFPAEAASAALIHYLRPGGVNKLADFASPDALAALMQRQGLRGVDRQMQERLLGSAGLLDDGA